MHNTGNAARIWCGGSNVLHPSILDCMQFAPDPACITNHYLRQYGRSCDIRLVESNTYVNNERMEEIVISRQDDKPTRICATWPNAVKPYITSLLRHPDAVPATFPFP